MKDRERTYRRLMTPDGLTAFRVAVNETDLYLQADRELKALTLNAILAHRGYLESYIHQYPEFRTCMSPWILRGPAPEIVRNMVSAGQCCGVGPIFVGHIRWF